MTTDAVALAADPVVRVKGFTLLTN